MADNQSTASNTDEQSSFSPLEQADRHVGLLSDILERIKVLEEQISTKDKQVQDNEYEEDVRRKPTKRASFNEKLSFSEIRHKWYRHTFPSDKEKSLRIENFRAECLSKALKYNTVDVVNSFATKERATTLVLPDWLSVKEKTIIKKKRDVKFQARMFLSILQKKDFDTVQVWINEESGLEKDIINHIWETYEEFNDIELITNRMCHYCTMKRKVDIADIIDHLISLEMISDDLYIEINNSYLKTGSQEYLWIKLAKECNSYPYPAYVKEAFTHAISNVAELTERAEDKAFLHRLLKELEKECDIQALFVCQCKEICCKYLQPLSLIKCMPLSNIYSSTQSNRKANKQTEGQCKNKTRSTAVNLNSLSSKAISPSTLKMRVLKTAETDTCSNDSVDTVTTDDKYKHISYTGIGIMDKVGERNTPVRKAKDKELTYRKIIATSTLDTGNETLLGSYQDNNNVNKTVCQKNSGSSAEQSDCRLGVFVDSSSNVDSSSDSLTSHSELAAKPLNTSNISGQQQSIADMHEKTPFKINAVKAKFNVYINCSKVAQTGLQSPDSAST